MVRDRAYGLLITNRKWHTPFQITRISLGQLLLLDGLKGQYCNRNCLGCSMSSLATNNNVYTVSSGKYVNLNV